jgi:hypothetical protein
VGGSNASNDVGGGGKAGGSVVDRIAGEGASDGGAGDFPFDFFFGIWVMVGGSYEMRENFIVGVVVIVEELNRAARDATRLRA